MDKINLDAVNLTTPIGTAMYPRLNEPDTKFDDAGVYKVNLLLGSEEGEVLAKTLTAYRDRAVDQVQGKKKINLAILPYSEEEDEEGNDTGNFIFKFKLKAAYEDRAGKIVECRPDLFGPDLKPTEVHVGGGSRIAVAFRMYPWFVPALGLGISLRLKAVQVVEAKSMGGSAESYQFRAVADAAPLEAPSTETPASDEGSYNF